MTSKTQFTTSYKYTTNNQKIHTQNTKKEAKKHTGITELVELLHIYKQNHREPQKVLN